MEAKIGININMSAKKKKGEKTKGGGGKKLSKAEKAEKQRLAQLEAEQEEEQEESPVEKEYTILQQGFDEVLKDLSGNYGVVRIKDEYQKVLRALKLALANERRLVMRGYNINNEIEPKKMLLDEVLEMSEEDQLVVETLKKELERILKMIDVSHDREKETRANTYVLKNELETFAKLIEESAKKQGDESSIFELIRLKDSLTLQRDEMQIEIDELRTKNHRLQRNEDRLTYDAETSMAKVAELEKELIFRRQENHEELKKRRQFEKDIRAMRIAADSMEAEMKQLKTQFELQGVEKSRLERIAKEMRTSLDKANKEADTTATRLSKLQGEFAVMETTNQNLLSENIDMKEKIKSREKETMNAIQENIKLNKLRDEMSRKIQVSETQAKQVVSQRDFYKNSYHDSQKLLESLKKKLEAETRRADIVSHERDVYLKELNKPNAELQAYKDLITVHEASIRKMDLEIIRLEKDAGMSQRLMTQLERAREEHLRGEIKQYNKVKQLMKKIQEKDIQMSDSLREIVSASEDKLRARQSATARSHIPDEL